MFEKKKLKLDKKFPALELFFCVFCFTFSIFVFVFFSFVWSKKGHSTNNLFFYVLLYFVYVLKIFFCLFDHLCLLHKYFVFFINFFVLYKNKNSYALFKLNVNIYSCLISIVNFYFHFTVIFLNSI